MYVDVCLIGNSRTADVTVTKIAGYVRVRILMNGSFFVFVAFIFLKLQPLFTRRVHMHLPGHRLCSAHERCTRVEPCDWSGDAYSVTTMLGMSLRAVRHNSSNVGGVTAGMMGHNSSHYNIIEPLRPECFSSNLLSLTSIFKL